jgi:hypothetical protein
MTLGEFLAANTFDADEMRQIRDALAARVAYSGGGGAQPTWTLTIPKYAIEFPDYGMLDVTIPDGFEEASWHNDACPSWINETLHLRLMVDYADPNDSEAAQIFGGEYHRFQIDRLTDDNQVRDVAPPQFWTFATFDEALAVIIGEQFAYELAGELTVREWNEMRRLNARPSYNLPIGRKGGFVCASHNFCDANMPMELVFRQLGLLHDGNDDDWANEATPESKRLVALWNAGWADAKKRHLTAED